MTTAARRWTRHVIVPGAGLAAAITAAGLAIEGPLAGWPAEDRLNHWCVRHRTPALDRVTWVSSTYADTPATIATALAAGLWRWRTTRSVPEAVAPVAAITVETAVFMAAAHAVRRARPDVPWLDRPAPTPSFPSGHTGATTALHLTLADALAATPGRGAHTLARTLRWGLPVTVAASRVYRGMHHPSDVVVGALLGAWTAGAVRRALGIRRMDTHPVDA